MATFVALVAAWTMVGGFTPAAYAAGGLSTPGATVIAMNLGGPWAQNPMSLLLMAHAQASTVANPSCRPEDKNIDCWGWLMLRLPQFGGMSVTGLQVHRVAVGNVACGDGGGCGDASATPTGAIVPAAGGTGVQAQVNGLGRLVSPGSSKLPTGTQVQVKITLTDNGHTPYRDVADVQVNQFISDSSKPLIYDSGPQTIQQVVLMP